MTKTCDAKKLLIKLDSVSKKYGSKEVLKEIGFNVYEGDKIYLSGINGAGKTTTLKIIAGIIKPDSGNVLFGSNTLFDNPVLRSNIGYMTTEAMFYEMLSVYDNLTMVAALYKIKDIKESVCDVIQKFDMDSYKNMLLSEISSGMKRRFQIAASLVHKPNILVWDEPFNTLDSQTIDLVQSLIEKYTIIFSTHDISLAKVVANREIKIIDGNSKEIFYE